MSKKLNRMSAVLAKGAFTLPEVLVTIALVAILAAVVVPTVANQVKKGDPNRVGSDALAMRGAVEQFLSDIRKYPNSVGQLTNTISTSASGMLLTPTTHYTTADVARWKGPYLVKDSVSSLTTGYGLSWTTTFTQCNFASPSVGTPACGAVSASNTNYLTLKIVGIDSLSWLAIDQAMDDGAFGGGLVRWTANCASCAGGVDTLFFLAMPVQP